mgnify:CR=1 FL=1
MAVLNNKFANIDWLTICTTMCFFTLHDINWARLTQIHNSNQGHILMQWKFPIFILLHLIFLYFLETEQKQLAGVRQEYIHGMHRQSTLQLYKTSDKHDSVQQNWVKAVGSSGLCSLMCSQFHYIKDFPEPLQISGFR